MTWPPSKEITQQLDALFGIGTAPLSADAYAAALLTGGLLIDVFRRR